jgi:hypothetical protein
MGGAQQDFKRPKPAGTLFFFFFFPFWTSMS